MDIIPKTRDIVVLQKEQVEDFLGKTWANMVELANDEDNGIYYTLIAQMVWDKVIPNLLFFFALQ